MFSRRGLEWGPPSALALSPQSPRVLFVVTPDNGASLPPLPDNLEFEVANVASMKPRPALAGHAFTPRRKGPNPLVAVLVAMPLEGECQAEARRARRAFKHAFVAVFHKAATEHARFRQECFDRTVQANMVTFEMGVVGKALRQVAAQGRADGGALQCPYCGLGGLSEDELWVHSPLYHVNWPNVREGSVCCVCDKEVHYRNAHGPCGRGEVPRETNVGLVAIVICRRPSDGKFLMVQEFAQSGFWVPGGMVDPGESLVEAVKREAMEEAGMELDIKGILTVETHGRRWRRVTFYAEPAADHPPKSLPDYESAGAVWVHAHELSSLRLRSESEPCRWFPYVADGGQVGPLEIPDKFKATMADVAL